MNNKDNSSYSIKKAAAFFAYIWAGAFFTILAASHLAAGFLDKHFNGEIITALACGLIIAAIGTMSRIKSGRMGEPVVNMRRYRYWAFAELMLFYALFVLGAVHLLDDGGTYIWQEILLAVFIGFFGALINVLHLIKKDKCSRKK